MTMEMTDQREVAHFFSGKKILVTGGTGSFVL